MEEIKVNSNKAPIMAILSYVDTDVIPNKEYAFYFECFEEPTISGSANITRHPVINRYEVADHMYREPISLTLQGSVQKRDGSFVVDGVSTTGQFLADFEKTFENLCKNGKVFSFYTVSTKDSKIRFVKRDNLVIKSYSWTEKNNSLNYSIGLEEIMIADVQEYVVDPEIDPTISDFDGTSLSEELFCIENVMSIVYNVLDQKGYLEESFKSTLNEQISSGEILLGVGIGTAAIAGVGIAIAVALSSNPVGWVCAAVIGVALLGYGLYKLIEGSNDKEYVKDCVAKFVDGDDVERFVNLCKNMQSYILAKEDNFSVLRFSNSGEQEACVAMDGEVYTFRVEKTIPLNRKTKDVFDGFSQDDFGIYNITCFDAAGNTVCGTKFAYETSKSSFTDLTSTNYLFRTSNSKWKVYLMFIPNDTISKAQKTVGMYNNMHDMTNYCILVMKDFTPEEFNQDLSTTIMDYLLVEKNN